jgi:hypothetical protein
MKRVRLIAATPKITIVDALRDELLLGAGIGDIKPWSRWLSVLRAAFALPMSKADLAAFKEVAGDREPPSRRVQELWAVVGRRSGKTRIAAAISVFIAAIERHTLSPGEVGCVLLLAASRSQAGIAYSYVRGFLEASPVLRPLIESVTTNEVRLRGNILISVHAGSYRTIRGRSLLAVVADETSFWRDESSAAPDVEIFRACAPALAATGGPWIGISTGYRKLGLLYQKWRDHFAQNDDDVLVIQGATTQFNSTLDAGTIDRAKKADPEAAESEWLGGFRSDIAQFLDDETIDAAIDLARPMELPPRTGFRYQSFTDPSGGRHDQFSLCVAHKEGDRFICDVIRGARPPFDPHSVVVEYAALLKQYGINEVTGDAYSAAWCETAFKESGIIYLRSEMAKSQLYLESLPLFMRGAVSIPDHPKLIRELRLLERRTSRIGKDVVDHGRNGSDDFANSLAGVLRSLANVSTYDVSQRWAVGSDEDAEHEALWRSARRWGRIGSAGIR